MRSREPRRPVRSASSRAPLPALSTAVGSAPCVSSSATANIAGNGTLNGAVGAVGVHFDRAKRPTSSGVTAKVSDHIRPKPHSLRICAHARRRSGAPISSWHLNDAMCRGVRSSASLWPMSHFLSLMTCLRGGDERGMVNGRRAANRVRAGTHAHAHAHVRKRRTLRTCKRARDAGGHGSRHGRSVG